MNVPIRITATSRREFVRRCALGAAALASVPILAGRGAAAGPGAVYLPKPTIKPPVVYKPTVRKDNGNGTPEASWVINDLPFDPSQSLTSLPNNPGNPNNMGDPKLGSAELWTVQNGGGGWTHPMHMHMEEHRVLQRVGSVNEHPDDTGREDVVALDPSESVTVYRNFRTFAGHYVAHCHNLAHEDHNMMFGWVIEP